MMVHVGLGMWARLGGLWLGKGDGGVGVCGAQDGALVEKDQRER
jgi:hypothetical protein